MKHEKTLKKCPTIFIDATASLSGGGVYINNLIGSLLSSNIKYKFVIYHIGNPAYVSRVPSGSIFDLKQVYYPSYIFDHWVLGSVYKLLWRTFILPVYLFLHKPDIFFSNSGYVPPLMPGKTKAIAALHNPIQFQPDLKEVEKSILRKWRIELLHRIAIRLVKKNVQFIIFNEKLKRQAIALGASPDQCTVIYHGIEWGEKERKQQTDWSLLQKLGVDVPYLLYVSQLHRYKNVIALLEAFSGIKKDCPSMHLVIVGAIADHGYGMEIEAAIRKYDLQDSVRVIPGVEREQLKSMYRESLAVVYPSKAEVCPFGLLEAMAMGKPIAASSIAAITEICADAALYFDPGSPEDMKSIIQLIIDQPSLRVNLSSRAIQRAMFFSWEKATSQTISVFEKALTKNFFYKNYIL